MEHKTTTIHSDHDNKFVAKIIEFECFWQLFLEGDEIILINKKDGKITHTTGEK
jgi:hypothetical protein